MNYSPLSLSRSLAAVLTLSLHLYSGSSCSEGSLQGWRCCRHRVLSAEIAVSMWWARCKCLTRHLVRMPWTVQSALAMWEVWDDPNWMWASICLVFIYLRSHFTLLSSSASPRCVQLPVQAPLSHQTRVLNHEQMLVLGRAVFYPGSIQWPKSYARNVLLWWGRWCRRRLMSSRLAQPAAAACEFCLWYSPATISIHCAMQVVIWGKISCVRQTWMDIAELILFQHLKLPCWSSG